MKRIFYTLLMVLAGSSLQAQEVTFHDYEALKDSMTQRMLTFWKTHKCINVNTVRRDLTLTMRPDNRVLHSEKLAAPRKKVLTPEQVYQRCKPSSLSFCMMEFRPQTKDYQAYATASAVALSEDGLCVTNFHVLSNVILSGALQYYWPNDFMRFVMTHEGKVYPISEILAADPINDFVIFRVNTGGDKLTPIPLGTPLVEGSTVYCLSHPKGNLFSFSQGIVSRNVKSVNKDNGQIKYDMEITADYGVGSSGGPIIDARGNLAGIVSATYSLYADSQTSQNFQMTIKRTVPVELIKQCLVWKRKK